MKKYVLIICLVVLAAGRAHAQSDDRQRAAGSFLDEFEQARSQGALENASAVPAAPVVQPKRQSEPPLRQNARVQAKNEPDYRARLQQQRDKLCNALQGETRPLRKSTVAFLGDRYYMSFGAGLGYVSGFSTYHLWFDNDYSVGGHGESELEWPFAGWLTSVNFSVAQKSHIPNRDRVRLDTRCMFNLSNKGSGVMKDSDWIQNDQGYIDYNDDGILNDSASWAVNNDGKDIYSESATKMHAFALLDMSLTYNLYIEKRWSLGLLFGFQWQRVKLSSYSVNQTAFGSYLDPRFDTTYVDTQNRQWGDYTVKSTIPYIGFSGAWSLTPDIDVGGRFGYSGWVRTKDKDVHLYPTADEAYGANYDMISTGRHKGSAFLFEGNAGWRINPFWVLNFSGSYTVIDVKGHMREAFFFGGIPLGTTDEIDHAVTSKYWMINTSLAYLF